MKELIIYVHGKGGNADEAEHYKQLFTASDVIGFDYHSQNPWDAKEEFSKFVDSYSAKYDSVILVANSIGAFFCLSSLSDKQIDKEFLISPIVNMEKLICDMMLWANVNESELAEKKEIKTDFGETLSWDYLFYVRENQIEWNVPTYMLYGEKDNLTSFETISKFANQMNASLTVMRNGEHWFHIDEQMEFLDNWIRQSMYGVDRQGNVAVFCSGGVGNLPEFVCENHERAYELIDYFEMLEKMTSSVLMFPQSKGAEQCARNFSDKGLYYFDANDGTKPGVCTFHEYYTKQSCPQLPLKYEQLPEKIREILKHNFMEIEDFLLVRTIQVNHAYK